VRVAVRAGELVLVLGALCHALCVI
jgi:hypothetical protein